MKMISDEYNPVRKAQTVYGSISGYYSFRGEKTIWFESTLERDFLFKQEHNGNVVDIVGQPISIPYTTELGNQSVYTPDFLVQFSSAVYDDIESFPAPLLIEIKPRKRLKKDWHEFRTKFKAAHTFASEKGWKFKIIDEFRLYDQFWENINFLKRFRRSYIDEFDQVLLIETLKKLENTTVNQLSAYIFKDEKNVLKAINQIWILVSKQIITCNLYQPFTTETIIWLNDKTIQMELSK